MSVRQLHVRRWAGLCAGYAPGASVGGVCRSGAILRPPSRKTRPPTPAFDGRSRSPARCAEPPPFVAFAYGPLAERVDRATASLPVWAAPGGLLVPLSLAAALVDLPRRFVQEYTLERRFGLSDQIRARLAEPTTRRAR